MHTRMSTRLDVANSKIATIKTVLKSHNQALQEHTTQLGSLLTSVGELIKSVSSLCSEVCDGFHWFPNGASLFSGSTPVGLSISNNHRLHTKHNKLVTFIGNDPVGWIAKAKTYFTIQGTPLEIILLIKLIFFR